MKVYHQTGHNLVWNLDSLQQDQAGEGIIVSPVNTTMDQIRQLDASVRKSSLYDPQFYAPESERGKLPSYPFFPSSILDDFSTDDFESICWSIASDCVEFQMEMEFPYMTIPVRYYGDLPSDYLSQTLVCFIEPFVGAVEDLGYEGPVLLTTIVKQGQIVDDEQRNYLLNWLTGIQDIDGVYLIFEHDSPSKQIHNPVFLANALRFIRSLKDNYLEIHIGYNNTEGILYSVAGPDSISMGAYENLRKFDSRRFMEIAQQGRQQPSPRLYSGYLFQWVEFTYVQAIQQLYSNWEGLFEESPYTPTDFQPGHDWNLRQPELYKHFFIVFSSQVNDLVPNIEDRFAQVETLARRAMDSFRNIEEAGVLLDSNSDGAHLNAWITALNLFRRT